MKPSRRPPTMKMLDGAAAEVAAAGLLELRGLSIVARNYRTKGGEIDIVAVEGHVVVFVEVRLRRSARFGGAGATIDVRKRARIIHAARHYLIDRPPCPCRFDAVLVDGNGLTWIRDAFRA